MRKWKYKSVHESCKNRKCAVYNKSIYQPRLWGCFANCFHYDRTDEKFFSGCTGVNYIGTCTKGNEIVRVQVDSDTIHILPMYWRYMDQLEINRKKFKKMKAKECNNTCGGLNK